MKLGVAAFILSPAVVLSVTIHSVMGVGVAVMYVPPPKKPPVVIEIKKHQNPGDGTNAPAAFNPSAPAGKSLQGIPTPQKQKAESPKPQVPSEALAPEKPEEPKEEQLAPAAQAAKPAATIASPVKAPVTSADSDVAIAAGEGTEYAAGGGEAFMPDEDSYGLEGSSGGGGTSRGNVRGGGFLTVVDNSGSTAANATTTAMLASAVLNQGMAAMPSNSSAPPPSEGSGAIAPPIGNGTPGADPNQQQQQNRECMSCGTSPCTNVLADPLNCGGCGNACATGQSCISGICTGGANKQYSVDWIFLPNTITERDDYGYDIDGDGKKDNQFFSFLSVLKEFGIELQNNIANLLWSGSSILLFDAAPPPETYRPVPLTLFQGEPTYPVQPNLWGGGSFVVDRKRSPTLFANGVRLPDGFTAMAPFGPTKPPVLQLYVRSPDGKASFTLPLSCHRILVKFDNNEKHLEGLLQGSMKRTELETVFAVEVANYMTNILNSPPGSVDPKLPSVIRIMFDNGGEKGECTSSDKNKTKGIAEDNVIAPCELYTNPTMKQAFDADIKVYDANGIFKPIPNGTPKDSLSFGLKFTANYATFR